MFASDMAAKQEVNAKTFTPEFVDIWMETFVQFLNEDEKEQMKLLERATNNWHVDWFKIYP